MGLARLDLYSLFSHHFPPFPIPTPLFQESIKSVGFQVPLFFLTSVMPNQQLFLQQTHGMLASSWAEQTVGMSGVASAEKKIVFSDTTRSQAIQSSASSKLAPPWSQTHLEEWSERRRERWGGGSLRRTCSEASEGSNWSWRAEWIRTRAYRPFYTTGERTRPLSGQEGTSLFGEEPS